MNAQRCLQFNFFWTKALNFSTKSTMKLHSHWKATQRKTNGAVRCLACWNTC